MANTYLFLMDAKFFSMDSPAVLLGGVRVAQRGEIFPDKQPEYSVAHKREYVASAALRIAVESEQTR